jgi:siroheme synthase-like protein
MKYYPLFLDIDGRECLVVGAGAVAARKARSLLRCGARVTVIGEKPVPALIQMSRRGLLLKQRRFLKSDVKQYALVFGATDDREVNSELSTLSRRRGMPVNIVDDPGQSSFIVPSMYHKGDLTVAVSTAGKSPAVARMAREEIGRRLGPHYAALAALLGTYRSRMMKMVPTGKERAKTWKRILASHVPELIGEGDRRGAAAEVKRQIAEAAGEEKRR